MIDVSAITDRYGRQARLYPALLVLVPVPLALFAWFPQVQALLEALVSVAVGCGVLFLLSQVGRDRGKRLEPELFKMWGGKPSVALLRWRDDRIDRHTKQQYHSFLGRAVPTAKFPTPVEEIADPGLADEAYEAATRWLLGKTRDTKLFRLLFNENIYYGFRRNLLGLRPFGIAVALGVAIASSGVAGERYFVAGEIPALSVVLASAVAWIGAVWWTLGVRPDWVRIPADQYALHLLAACATLSEPHKPLSPGAGVAVGETA